MRKFMNYDVTADARQLAVSVYRLLPLFPNEERYALCQQLRRAVVSIGANIAEGAGRATDKDFAHFLSQSIGSACELEYLFLISLDLGYLDHQSVSEMDVQTQRIKSRLFRFRERLLTGN